MKISEIIEGRDIDGGAGQQSVFSGGVNKPNTKQAVAAQRVKSLQDDITEDTTEEDD